MIARDPVPMRAASPVALLCAWALDGPYANAQGGNGTAESGGANATCAFAFTTEQALAQHIQLDPPVGQLLAEHSVGSAVVSVALIVVGAVLLAAGYRVFKGVLFAAGFIGGFMGSWTGTSALFNMIPQLFNCWVLTIVPIRGDSLCPAARRLWENVLAEYASTGVTAVAETCVNTLHLSLSLPSLRRPW